MKLINRPMHITNTDGNHWQVSLPGITGTDDGLENIDITVLLRRGDASLPQLQVQAVRRAVQLLQHWLAGADPAPGTPGGADQGTNPTPHAGPSVS